MESFFGVFLDKINRREENSDAVSKGGRYLALILEEVIRRDPAFVNILFPQLGKFIPKKMPEDNDFEVETEYPFEQGGKSRRADLSVKYGGRRALLEIKWNDTLIENQDGSQLEDYIAHYNRKNDCIAISILHLEDKFTPEQRKLIEKELSRGRPIAKISCADLYYAIERKLNSGARATAAMGVQEMLLEYLGENVMKYTAKVSMNALKMIMANGLCLSHDNNGQFNSNATTAQVPDAWKALLDNFSDVNSRICAQIKESNNGVISKIPVTYFSFQPYFPLRELRKTLNLDDGDEGDACLSRSGERGGITATKGAFSIYSTIYKNDKVLRLYYGTYFWVDKTKDKFDITYYAYCGGKGYEEIEREIPLKKGKEDGKDVYILPGRDEMYGLQLKIISEFLCNALQAEKGKGGKTLSPELAEWYRQFCGAARTLLSRTGVE